MKAEVVVKVGGQKVAQDYLYLFNNWQLKEAG